MANKPSTVFFALTVIVMSLLPHVHSVKKDLGLGPGPQIVSDQFPSPFAYPLDQQDASYACSPFTPLFIDGPIFVSRTARIGAGPEIQFQVYGASLRHTQIEPWLEPVNMTDQIVLADSTAKAFTMNDPTVAFRITFLEHSGVKFRYSNYDPETRCFDIALKRKWKSRWRLTVGETPEMKDLDTLNSLSTETRFCKDRLVIRLSRQPLKRY